ncbi:MAG: replication factor C large subunit [Halobacteriaceae archaeon]
MTSWTEKYRPSSLSEIRGNDKARDQLQEWGESWEEHNQAVILHGSPGIGKTSAAHALAADMNWETIELNASDQRTSAIIEKIAGEAAKTGTLTEGGAGRKLIILDEADNLHGNADRGGARAITEVVKEATQPIVLIANDYYEMSNTLRNICQDIEFRDVSKRSITPVLRDICRRENIEFEEDALETIAEKNSGDLRAAINDLQAISEDDKELTIEDVTTGDRDRTIEIFDYLDGLIKEYSAQEALESSYSLDESPDDLINWIEDNMPKDYEGAELTQAYEFLANADQWLGRVRSTQNYSYWRYASDNMTAGVAAARQKTKGGWTRYNPPSYWSKLGRTSGTRNTRDYIARQIAETSGVSMATARREIMPLLATMTHHCHNRSLTVAMAAKYDFDAKHLSFITGSGKDTNKVNEIITDAQQLRSETTTTQSGDATNDRSEKENKQEEIENQLDTSEPESAASDSHDEDEADDNQSDLDEFF